VQWERKFWVVLELNFRVYFRNKSFVCAVIVSSRCGSRSRQFLTRSSSHHPSCHVLSRNLTPAFGDELLYMLQFRNHSVCPIVSWVHFASIHCLITSNTPLHLPLLFLCGSCLSAMHSIIIELLCNPWPFVVLKTLFIYSHVLLHYSYFSANSVRIFAKRVSRTNSNSMIADGLIACHTPRKLSQLINITTRWHFCWKVPEVLSCVAF